MAVKFTYVQKRFQNLKKQIKSNPVQSKQE